jgi:tetratricopeptide (TPR) repeat protein
VIRLDPNSAVAHTNLGNLLRQRGNLREAIEQYRDALSKDPGLDRPHLGLGMALATLGDFATARKEFEEAARSADPGVHQAAQDALQKLQSFEAR